MKTVKESAEEYAERESNDFPTGDARTTMNLCEIEDWFKDSFKAGAEFAQRWIPVEDELPEVSKQVIVKLPNDWHTCTWLMKDGTFAFNVKPTHWRPIELK